MPSRLRNRDGIPIDTIELDGGDWVKVRRWLTAQDRDEMNDRLTKIDEKALTGKYDTEKASRNMVLQILTAWGGPGLCEDEHEDADGEPLDIPEDHVHRPVPITFENVSMLHDMDLRTIVTHISRRNPRAVPPVADGPFPQATTAGVN